MSLPVAILAGGLGTRLGVLGSETPKALMDIGGRPFIALQLELLRSHGFTDIVLCTGHLGGQIEAVVGDGRDYGVRVRYSPDGPALLGTGGALRRALPLLGEAFFVLYGDSFLECDYREVERTFRASGCPGLMTVFRNEGLWDSSNVELVDGRIVRYDKRRKTAEMHYIDYGLGALNAEVLSAYPEDTFLDLAAVYQKLVADGGLAAFEVPERFFEIGTPAGLDDLRRHLSIPRRKAGVFLDRDGVINRAVVHDGKPFPAPSVDQLEILPGVADALARFRAAGLAVVVVTNQPDVARGRQSRGVVESIHDALREKLGLQDIRVCYHDDDDHCSCRKPLPGLLLDAAAERGIDLRSSVMVGDRWRDVEAGRRAGCATILIDYGYAEPECVPDLRVPSLIAAADWILARTAAGHE